MALVPRTNPTRMLKRDAEREIRNLEELRANYTGEASETALRRLDAITARLRAWQRS